MWLITELMEIKLFVKCAPGPNINIILLITIVKLLTQIHQLFCPICKYISESIHQVFEYS